LGKKGDEIQNFKYPMGIAIDSKDRVIVADYGNDRIQIFDDDLNFIQKFTCSARPYQISIDVDDNMFIMAGNYSRSSRKLIENAKKIEIFSQFGTFIRVIDFSDKKIF